MKLIKTLLFFDSQHFTYSFYAGPDAVWAGAENLAGVYAFELPADGAAGLAAEAFCHLNSYLVIGRLGTGSLQIAVTLCQAQSHQGAGESTAASAHIAHAETEGLSHLKSGCRICAKLLCKGTDDSLTTVIILVMQINCHFFFCHRNLLTKS